MPTKTLEATYDNGVLRLAEPLDLAPRSRVRVRIELITAPGPKIDILDLLNEAYGDTPDAEERTLQRHMARLRREQVEEW